MSSTRRLGPHHKDHLGGTTVGPAISPVLSAAECSAKPLAEAQWPRTQPSAGAGRCHGRRLTIS